MHYFDLHAARWLARRLADLLFPNAANSPSTKWRLTYELPKWTTHAKLRSFHGESNLSPLALAGPERNKHTKKTRHTTTAEVPNSVSDLKHEPSSY